MQNATPKFLAKLLLSPRKSIRDPEAATIMGALTNLGFEGITSLRISREITFTLEAPDAVTAQDRAAEMAEKAHLHNPVMQDLKVSVDPLP